MTPVDGERPGPKEKKKKKKKKSTEIKQVEKKKGEKKKKKSKEVLQKPGNIPTSWFFLHTKIAKSCLILSWKIISVLVVLNNVPSELSACSNFYM